WQELADPDWFSEDTLAKLNGINSPHTLSVGSYPTKSRESKAAKRDWLAAIKTTWILLGALVGVLFLIAILLSVRRPESVIVLLISLVIIGTLVASVQRVREASVRTAISNNLRQIALASHDYHDAKGTLRVWRESQG